MLTYIVQRPLEVDGRTLQPGEVAPDAESWRNLRALLDQRYLRLALPATEAETPRQRGRKVAPDAE